MSNLEQRIGSIHSKLQQLIEAQQTALGENAELKETVIRLSRELSTKESIITKINTELETREKDKVSADNNKQIKEEIDECVKGVEACIEMVNELV